MSSAVSISDPEPAIRDTQASNASKRNKILIGVGAAVLILGGVGAAVALTMKSKSSDSSNTSGGSNSNNNGGNNNGENTVQDTYARGYVQPPDAAEQVASLNAAAFVEPLVAALPATVDWRTNSAVVGPVKNQGGCGSCWAFAAVEAMEGSYGMKYNKQIILSPQQLVDCDLKDGGCNGGWMMTAWTQYFKNNARPYALTESQYPYSLMSPNGKQRNTCSVDDSKGPVMVTSATNVMSSQTWSLQQEQTVMGYIAQNGPVSIAISAKGWGNYKGGIATSGSLGCDQQLDHGVELVGFGEQNGQGYWIVRNSWSASWGEAGFIRLARGSNTCCVLCAVMGVTVAATGNATPNTPVTSAPTNSKLNAGQQLTAGSQLTSPDGNKIFKVQTDGNLVLYKTVFAALNSLQAVWASNTFGGNFVLKMQPDCNLVLYNSNGGAVWNSATSKPSDSTCSSAYLTVQNDGNLVLYKGTSAIWSTNTWDNNAAAPTTKAPVVTPTTAKPAAKTLSVASLGCWRDDASRVLKTRLSAASNAVMRDCAFLAYNAGKTHFGLQYGGECWGGDATFNRLGQAGATCNMKCQGDATQMCGGSYALTMYQIVSTSQFPDAQELPAPVAPFTIDSDCTMHKGFPSYCWRCVNNIDNVIRCQDATVANLHQDLELGQSGFVYPGLCPDESKQNPAEICGRSSKKN